MSFVINDDQKRTAARVGIIKKSFIIMNKVWHSFFLVKVISFIYMIKFKE